MPKALTPPSCDDRPLYDVMYSAWQLPTLAAADELGLFPALAETPRSAEQVAEHLGLGPRATEAMLGVLTALGFLRQHEGAFHLTDVSHTYLLPDRPYYWGGMLGFMRNAPTTYANVLEALKRDAPRVYGGEDMWETHQVDPAQAEVFTSAMHSHSFPAAMGMARRGDFTGVRRLLDVAGGSGCFCIALALRYPDMRFTVAELDVVRKLTERHAAEFEVQDRIDTVALDMFHDPFPTGHDAVFFSNIFHDWGQDRCRHLARASFEALPPGGRIYLHEMLLADTKDGPLPAVSFSMAMMFFTDGKQYSLGELRDILEESGFGDVGVTPSYGHYSLVSARKP